MSERAGEGGTVMSVHEKIATEPELQGPWRVRCLTCGKTVPLRNGDFAYSLRYGWQKCHGYTMRLERPGGEG